MNETHQREAAVFDAALELPPSQRAAYVERACAGNPALMERIRALLRACEDKSAYLDGPPPVSPLTPSLGAEPLVTAGHRVGRYKLHEQIGEGGCGVVYLAEQEQPVRRAVELKVVKLGMDTKSVGWQESLMLLANLVDVEIPDQP